MDVFQLSEETGKSVFITPELFIIPITEEDFEKARKIVEGRD